MQILAVVRQSIDLLTPVDRVNLLRKRSPTAGSVSNVSHSAVQNAEHDLELARGELAS